MINRLRIAGQPLALAELGEREVHGLVLEPSQNQIELDFFGLNFALGAPLRYQYKFEGFDRDWSAPSEQRTVAANLAPGSYRFLVRAVNANGQVSETPAVVSFTILPPFWQRWWFILLAALAVSGLAYLGHRYHVGRVIEVERVRTRIATDLHDDIGASLSRMAILSEVVKQTNGHTTQSAGMTEGYIRTWLEESMALYNAVEAQHLHPEVRARQEAYLTRIRELGEQVIRELGIWVEVEETSAREQVSTAAAVQRVIGRNPQVQEELSCLGALREYEEKQQPGAVTREPAAVEECRRRNAAQLQAAALARVAQRNGEALQRDVDHYRLEHPQAT
ncbi:MAG: hypothetical protein HY269_03350, partial [Deltaproteobacteria bacterium]|nr:hypothetical protein [Deltaproteobacteria bacterium]